MLTFNCAPITSLFVVWELAGKMNLVAATVLLFATFGFAGAAVNSAQNYTAQFATSNITELIVQLDVPVRNLYSVLVQL